MVCWAICKRHGCQIGIHIQLKGCTQNIKQRQLKPQNSTKLVAYAYYIIFLIFAMVKGVCFPCLTIFEPIRKGWLFGTTAAFGSSQALGVLICGGNDDLHVEHQQNQEEVDEILSTDLTGAKISNFLMPVFDIQTQVSSVIQKSTTFGVNTCHSLAFESKCIIKCIIHIYPNKLRLHDHFWRIFAVLLLGWYDWQNDIQFLLYCRKNATVCSYLHPASNDMEGGILSCNFHRSSADATGSCSRPKVVGTGPKDSRAGATHGKVSWEQPTGGFIEFLLRWLFNMFATKK